MRESLRQFYIPGYLKDVMKHPFLFSRLPMTDINPLAPGTFLDLEARFPPIEPRFILFGCRSKIESSSFFWPMDWAWYSLRVGPWGPWEFFMVFTTCWLGNSATKPDGNGQKP